MLAMPVARQFKFTLLVCVYYVTYDPRVLGAHGFHSSKVVVQTFNGVRHLTLLLCV